MAESILTLTSPPGHAGANEVELVAAAKKDPSAFTKLYRRYVGGVYGYLYQRTGDPAMAQRLTEQVFLDAVDGIPNFSTGHPFAAWLFAIVRRKLNGNRRVAPVSQDRLLALIQGLDEADQELLYLRCAAGLSVGEIAALLDSPAESITHSLERLLSGLQAQLEVNHD